MTNEMTFSQAQADMRVGYAWGAAGVLVSGVVWLAAGVVSVTGSASAAVVTLLAGGAVIHPLGMLVAKVMGAPGRHSSANPLARLAGEGTFWMLAGIAVACGLYLARPDWFFPAMLLVIGGRYLSFQTLYGVSMYWVLGGLLCALGVVAALVAVPAHLVAFGGGALEVLFGILLFNRYSGVKACSIT